jgi:hypothetical protein
LLQEHLAFLHGEASLSPSEAERVALFAEQGGKPLSLTPQALPRKKRWPPVAALGVLLAACLALWVWPKAEEPDLLAKGSAKVFVVVSTQNDRRVLSNAEDLPAGSKVGAEIKATEPTTAFLAVFNREGVGLLSSDLIVQNGLELKAGAREYFSTALELVGPSEGERLVVVVCQSAAFHQSFANPVDFVSQHLMKAETATEGQLPEFCGVKSLQLRK